MSPGTNFSTMPDLHCPDWCDRDHDGLGTGGDLSAADAADEQLHLRHSSGWTSATACPQRSPCSGGSTAKTVLYLVAEGVLAACAGAHVRSRALTAADMLDGLLR